MAIWQITLLLIKENGLIDYNNNLFLRSLRELEMVFPQEKSWCESIKQYGNIESTCFEFDWSNDEIKDDISLRIDLRSITWTQLNAICAFANSNGLLLKYKESVYMCNMENFLEIFLHSKSKAFLDNPEAFLKDLKHKMESE